MKHPIAHQPRLPLLAGRILACVLLAVGPTGAQLLEDAPEPLEGVGFNSGACRKFPGESPHHQLPHPSRSEGARALEAASV